MEVYLVWVLLKLSLMACLAYFIRAFFQAQDAASGFAKKVVIPNLVSFVLLLGGVSVIKFFASLGASLKIFAPTILTIAAAQLIWLAYDWMRFKEVRTGGRWRKVG